MTALPETTEGWWRPWNGRRWHYIVDGRSLCNRWAYFGDGSHLRPHIEASSDPEECKACAKARSAREQS